MDGQLTSSLKISTAMHVAVLGALVAIPLIFSSLHRTPRSIAVDFTVAVPQPRPEPWVKPSPPAPVAAPVEPEEVVVHRDPGPGKAKPKPVKQPPIVPHNQPKVVRYPVNQVNPTPTTKPLSQREISDLLARGAKVGAETVIPDVEDRYMATIQNALYNAWSQPSAEEARNAVVEVEIRLGAGGVVTDWRIVRKSGVALMDASVARAVQSVRRIQGLSASFIGRHETVTIAFRVEQ